MYLADTYEHPHAGTEQQLIKLIIGLDSTEFDTAMTLLRDSQYIKQNGFPCPVEILDINKMFSFVSLFKIISFARSLKKKGYKLVHIFFNDASIIAPIILRICGLKVIVSRRDMGFWHTKVNLLILRLNSYFVNVVIANSEAVKQVTHKKEGVSLKKIFVIYNGHEPVNPSVQPKQQLDGFPIFKSRSKKVGIVANIRPVKRIDDLIKAFHLVKNRNSDVDLIIVGAGDNKHLIKLADELALNNSVHFLGGQSNTIPIIKHFDVAVLCSETEGFSNSIIEYMSCQVPVVCTDTGGNRELIIDGVTGFLVPVGDIRTLADKIYRTLNISGPDKNAILENAYQRIGDICDYDKMISMHKTVYNTL